MLLRTVLALAVISFNVHTIHAALLTDFENLSDGTAVTNQILGAAFSNATVLTAGIGLNEFQFPPHSGTNVATDSGGPMGIVFTMHIKDFEGYFTYTT